MTGLVLAGSPAVRPVLLVVADPNGAGKTTVTARLRVVRWSEGVTPHPDLVDLRPR